MQRGTLPSHEVIDTAKARPSKKRARPKKRPALAKSGSIPPQPQRTWATTIFNLVLLVAIFTIVFAAHKNIQKNRQQEVVVMSPSEQTVVPSFSSGEQSPDLKVGTTQPATATEAEPQAGPATAQPVTEENVVEQAPETPTPLVEAKRAKRHKAPYAKADPYTSGGKLDLDSETARQEYKNKNYQ